MTWNPLLGAALDAADRGWHVFPLVPAGKVPLLRSWEQRATTDKRQIYRWWADVEANVGVATGRSGLVVIDLDDGRGAARRSGSSALATVETCLPCSRRTSARRSRPAPMRSRPPAAGATCIFGRRPGT